MVNLKAKPYYLSDEDIAWVEATIAGMTDEEKVGQLSSTTAVLPRTKIWKCW